MTLHSDSESRPQSRLQRPNGATHPAPDAAPQRSLGEALVQVSQILKEQLGRIRSSAKPVADGAARNLAPLGRKVVDQVRRRPVATALAVAGAGVGLAFLLSARARSAAVDVGAKVGKSAKRLR
jgi:hypothetical protein